MPLDPSTLHFSNSYQPMRSVFVCITRTVCLLAACAAHFVAAALTFEEFPPLNTWSAVHSAGKSQPKCFKYTQYSGSPRAFYPVVRNENGFLDEFDLRLRVAYSLNHEIMWRQVGTSLGDYEFLVEEPSGTGFNTLSSKKPLIVTGEAGVNVSEFIGFPMKYVNDYGAHTLRVPWLTPFTLYVCAASTEFSSTRFRVKLVPYDALLQADTVKDVHIGGVPNVYTDVGVPYRFPHVPQAAASGGNVRLLFRCRNEHVDGCAVQNYATAYATFVSDSAFSFINSESTFFSSGSVTVTAASTSITSIADTITSDPLMSVAVWPQHMSSAAGAVAADCDTCQLFVCTTSTCVWPTALDPFVTAAPTPLPPGDTVAPTSAPVTFEATRTEDGATVASTTTRQGQGVLNNEAGSGGGRGGSDSSLAIVFGVVGTVVGVCALAFVLFFVLVRHPRRQRTKASPRLSRHTSQLQLDGSTRNAHTGYDRVGDDIAMQRRVGGGGRSSRAHSNAARRSRTPSATISRSRAGSRATAAAAASTANNSAIGTTTHYDKVKTSRKQAYESTFASIVQPGGVTGGSSARGVYGGSGSDSGGSGTRSPYDDTKTSLGAAAAAHSASASSSRSAPQGNAQLYTCAAASTFTSSSGASSSASTTYMARAQQHQQQQQQATRDHDESTAAWAHTRHYEEAQANGARQNHVHDYDGVRAPFV